MAITSKKAGDSIRNPEGPVVIRHPRVRVYRDDDSILEGAGADFGVRGHDGCDSFRLEGLEITGCGHGCRMTGAEGGRILGVHSHHNAGEGLQGGNLTDLIVEDVTSHENGRQGQERRLGIPEWAAHGIYFDANGVIMRRVKCFLNGGCGLHARGRDWLIEHSEFTKNLLGSGVGAPDVQLTSVILAALNHCLIADGNAGLTLYNENGPCREVSLQDSAIWAPDGKHAVYAWGGSVLKVGGGLIVGALKGTRPSVAPTTLVSATANPTARAALQAWQGQPAEEPPPPGTDLRLQLTRALAELEAARQREAAFRERLLAKDAVFHAVQELCAEGLGR